MENILVEESENRYATENTRLRDLEMIIRETLKKSKSREENPNRK